MKLGEIRFEIHVDDENKDTIYSVTVLEPNDLLDVLDASHLAFLIAELELAKKKILKKFEDSVMFGGVVRK